MIKPYTIRIFVPEGDPEGIRIIDKMNWTGTGVVFPRSKWDEVRKRQELNKTGVYILVGHSEGDEDIPTVYVGQGDGIRSRIDKHVKEKDFWDTCIVFVSNNNGLNRAHITWLEYALVNKAAKVGQCRLDNGNVPQEPVMSEFERADTEAFFDEMLQILPLVSVRSFEFPKAVVTTKLENGVKSKVFSNAKDTIVVPAQKEGFEKVFLGENCWHSIRISGGMIDKIKYIAAYQTNPVCAVTHYAPVSRIEPFGDSGKFRLIFSEPAKEIGPIPFADAPTGSMQGPRYTNFEKLKSAKTIMDLFHLKKG